MVTVRRPRPHLIWGLLDQGLASGSSFALGLMVLRASSLSEFGAFVLVMGAYWVALASTRAVTAFPLLLVHVDDHRELRSAAGSVWLIAALVSPLVAAAALVARGDSRNLLLLLALGLPVLLAQDSFRYRMIAQRNTKAAAASGLAWAVALAGILSLVYWAQAQSATTLFASWIVSAAISLAAVEGSRRALAFCSPKPYLRRHRSTILSLLPEALVCSLLTHFNLVILAWTLSAAELGRVRTCFLVFGPIFMIFSGLTPTLIVELRNRMSTRRESALKVVRLASALFAVGIATSCSLIVVLPGDLLEKLLGPAATEARPLIVPVGLYCAAAIWANLVLLQARLVLDLRTIALLRYTLVLVEPAVIAVGASTVGAAGAMLLGAGWLALFNVSTSPYLKRRLLDCCVKPVAEHRVHAGRAVSFRTTRQPRQLDRMSLFEQPENR